MEGAAIGGCGGRADTVPESGGVMSAGTPNLGAPDGAELEGADAVDDGGRSTGAVLARTGAPLLDCDCGAVAVGHPKPCATTRICGFSGSGRAANSRRSSSATPSAAQHERMWRQQSATSSRRPELVNESAGSASRHSSVAYSYSARSVSGNFAKFARRKSRIELWPAFAISRRNCASIPRMTRSTSLQLRSTSQAARKSTKPNAAVPKISAESRGSIGGETEFAEMAASAVGRVVGGAREIGSGAVFSMKIAIGGSLECGEVVEVLESKRVQRRTRSAEQSKFNREE